MARRISPTQPEPPTSPALVGSPEGEEKSLGRARVSIVRRSTRLLDRDNLFASVKWLLDWLCIAKLIPGNDPDSIELEVTQEKVRKDQVGTQVIISQNNA
jgi:hypothetical protein